MQSKLTIKVGSFEASFEGSEEFIKRDFTSFLRTITELFPLQNVYIEDIEEKAPKETPSLEQQMNPNSSLVGTTNTIAAKLNVKSGPELVIAAAARLTFVNKQETFHYRDLLNECKSATSYYRQSYGNNLQRTLKNLVKDNKLNEVSKDHYTLAANERKRLEGLLA